MLHLLGFLFGQRQATKVYATTSCILLVMWILLALVMGKAYKECLCSTLSSILLPHAPETLAEILDSDLIITTFSQLEKLDKTKEKSVIKSEIGKLLEEVRHETFNTSQLEQQYKNLKARLKNIDSPNHLNFFVKVLNQDPVFLEGIRIVMPGIFLIFDSQEVIREIELMTLYFGKNLFQLGREDFLFFQYRSQWMFQRNYFLELVYPYLQAISESGVYDRWNYYHGVRTQLNLLHKVKNILKLRTGDSSLRIREENILSFLFSNKSIKYKNLPVPICLRFFGPFFYCFDVLLLMNMFVFLWESKVFLGQKCSLINLHLKNLRGRIFIS